MQHKVGKKIINFQKKTLSICTYPFFFVPLQVILYLLQSYI